MVADLEPLLRKGSEAAGVQPIELDCVGDHIDVIVRSVETKGHQKLSFGPPWARI
jgi:hypothetical protein